MSTETSPMGTSDHSVLRRRRIAAEDLGYVVPLDGLRALAVIAVVLYHSHFAWIPGGFLGVSAFFTLSGFLITALILREWSSSSTLGLRSFWTRRFRRLLPAEWVTMAVILVLGVVGVWNDDQLRAVRGDLPYSLLEILNWHFIAVDRSYAADFAAPSPFAHFWSLAVEQQFYVFLPLLALAVLTLGARVPPRRRLQRLVALFVVLTVYSAVSNWFFARTSIDRAYYGTDTRMAEMLIGSLLACATLRRLRLPAGWARHLALVAGGVATVVLAVMWHVTRLDSSWLYPWGFLLSALCTSALIFAAVQHGLVANVLSVAPLVALGRISYGVYLLHWPVFLWVSPGRVDLGPWPLFGLRMAITIAGAVLMFRLVEHPIRHGSLLQGRRTPVLAGVSVIALLAGTFALTSSVGPPPADSFAAQSPRSTTIPPPPVRVLFVGDDMATSLADSLRDVEGFDVSAVGAPSCGLVLGGWVALPDGTVERDVDRCRATRNLWLEGIAATAPDVVLLVTSPRDAADRRLSLQTPWAGAEDPAIADFLNVELGSLVDDVTSTGVGVGLVTLPDVANTTPLSAVPLEVPPSASEEGATLMRAEAIEIAAGVPARPFPENDPARADQVNAVVTAVAADRGVPVFDLAAQARAWPGGALDPEMRLDGVGFTPEAGELIAEWLLPLLRDRAPVVAAASPTPVIAADAPLPPAPAAGPRRVVAPGERLDVLVVGDSVAWNVASGLSAWADGDTEATNGSKLGCPIARGGSYRFKRDTVVFAEDCDWSTFFPELLTGYRPDLVVLSSGIWEVVDRRLPGDDRFRSVGDPGVDRYVLGEFLAAIDQLSVDGATVVVLTQPGIRPGLDQGFQDLPEGEPERIDRLNEMLAEAVSLRPGVARLVDFRSWVVAQPGGEHNAATRADGVHFNAEVIPSIGDWLGPQLRSIASGV